MTITARLSDVALINPKPKVRPETAELISFVPMASLDATTASTDLGIDRCFEEVQKGYTIFADGDVLVAKITPCFENSKIAQAQLARKVGVGSTEFHVIRPLVDRLDARYLLHFLRQPRVLLEGKRQMTGSAGQRRVPTGFLQKLKIPLPLVGEQRRIAAILDHADVLRVKRREALARFNDLADTIFLDMFSTLLGSRGTSRVRLKSLTSLITKGTTPTSVGLNFVRSGVPFLRVQNLVDGAVAFSPHDLFISDESQAVLKRSRIFPYDVLVSIAGTIGRSAIVPNDFPEMNCNQAIAVVRPREGVSSEFIRAWLSTHDALRQISTSAVTATISNLSLSQLGGLMVPVIRESDQREFSRRIEGLQHIKRHSQASGVGMERLFHSLQARAFSGQL